MQNTPSSTFVYGFKHPLAQLVLAAICGLCITLSLAPFAYWPLAILASALFYTLLQNNSNHSSPKRLLGWCFGLGLFGSGASWVYVSIHDFGYTSTALASVITGLFCAGLALLYAFTTWIYTRLAPCGLANTVLKALYFAIIFTASEWLRSWLLTGFPWLFIGYSQTTGPLSGYAPIIGVYGISFILYFTGALIGQFLLKLACRTSTSIDQKKKSFSQSIMPIAIMLFIWLGAVPLKAINWTTLDLQKQTVSIIQANISQHEKWRPQNLAPTKHLYRTLSQPHWQKNHLIIWPEAAIPSTYQNANSYFKQIHTTAKQANAALLTGIPYYDKTHQAFYNSVVAIGEGAGTYHKQRLVPFGEYVPFIALMGDLLAFFELPLSTMSSGHKNQAPLTLFNWQTQPLICYEIVYPSLSAQAAKQSDALITVSNDSWFGASIGPLQHLQMAQMRALETGRYVLRSTGNGVSAIINEKGVIQSRSQQFTREVLNGEFYLSSGNTPWVRVGYRLVPLLLSISLALILAVRLGQSRKK